MLDVLSLVSLRLLHLFHVHCRSREPQLLIFSLHPPHIRRCLTIFFQLRFSSSLNSSFLFYYFFLVAQNPGFSFSHSFFRRTAFFIYSPTIRQRHCQHNVASSLFNFQLKILVISDVLALVLVQLSFTKYGVQLSRQKRLWLKMSEKFDVHHQAKI